MTRLTELFSFRNPVNETSSRVVAAGVVTMASATVALDQPWLLIPLTYGFAARVATGPTLSPLGQLATRVVTPRLPGPHRQAPGAPKRLAQGMGLALSGTATALHFGFGRRRAAYGMLGCLIVAAGLEAGFGLCLACKDVPAADQGGAGARECLPRVRGHVVPAGPAGARVRPAERPRVAR